MGKEEVLTLMERHRVKYIISSTHDSTNKEQRELIRVPLNFPQ